MCPMPQTIWVLFVLALPAICYGAPQRANDNAALTPISEERLNQIRTAMFNSNHFGGDMLGGLGVPNMQADGAVAGFIANSRFTYWTNAVVYYEYDRTQGTTSLINEAVFNEAIAEIESKTCVRFKNRNGDTSIVAFVKVTAIAASGCNSYVGMDSQGQYQQLNLGTGCWDKGVIIHEIMHAMGFHHEHQRYDRDNYITVNSANMATGADTSWTVMTQAEANTVGLQAYDIGSIMHYDTYSTGKLDANGNQLPVALVKGTGATISHPSQRPYLSTKDTAMVNAIYGSTCSTLSSATTAAPGASAAKNRLFSTFVRFLDQILSSSESG